MNDRFLSTDEHDDEISYISMKSFEDFLEEDVEEND